MLCMCHISNLNSRYSLSWPDHFRVIFSSITHTTHNIRSLHLAWTRGKLEALPQQVLQYTRCGLERIICQLGVELNWSCRNRQLWVYYHLQVMHAKTVCDSHNGQLVTHVNHSSRGQYDVKICVKTSGADFLAAFNVSCIVMQLLWGSLTGESSLTP